MNDISKARFFLKAHGSKLETLETFPSMMAAAESRYMDLRRRLKTNEIPLEELGNKEMEATVDLAVLRFLKNRGRLPENVGEIIHPDTSEERKMELARNWFSA